MRLNAYVLAADPTWLQLSVAAYYPAVGQLVVSYDARNRGWTGRRIAASKCVHLVEAIDLADKIQLLPGDYAKIDPHPLFCETQQRQEAVHAASEGADWVLQVDGDELLPHPDQLRRVLEALPDDVQSLEWPMRVLYRRLRDGSYLEIVTEHGNAFHEYPGPIAVRAHARLIQARRPAGTVARVVMRGQGAVLVRMNEPDVILMDLGDVTPILHNSWAREPRVVARKVATWGHNQGWRSWRYYFMTWLPSARGWRDMRNIHPLYASEWPRLAISDVRDPALP